MRHRIQLTVVAICVVATLAGAQAFDVVSVKLNKSAGRLTVRSSPGSGRLAITGITVKALIARAYAIQDFEVVNADSPVMRERVDIEARSEKAVASVAEMQKMLQPVLADRFKLAVHRETHEMNVLALVLANKDGRLGPKMKNSSSSCDDTAVSSPTNDRPACGYTPSGVGRIVGVGMDMAAIVGTIAPSRGMPVIDQTGLTGRYDIDMTYTPEAFSAATLAQRGGTPPPGVDVDANGPSMFRALEEQLGLKLEAKKLPVSVLVVDHIEMPTEN